MTITQSDRRTYQSKVSEFERQEAVNTCLSRSIQNILGELSDRHDRPEITIDHDVILDVCDYLPKWGCSVEFLPESLNGELNQHGYSAYIETHLEVNELESIIENDQMSFPIVELSPAYLHHADGYEVQDGMYGQAQPHTVVAFTVNDELIQFFDPYEDFYSPPDSGGAPPSQITQSQFYQWWSGREEKRWTMWIEEEPQQTFDHIQAEPESDEA